MVIRARTEHFGAKMVKVTILGSNLFLSTESQCCSTGCKISVGILLVLATVKSKVEFL